MLCGIEMRDKEDKLNEGRKGRETGDNGIHSDNGERGRDIERDRQK